MIFGVMVELETAELGEGDGMDVSLCAGDSVPTVVGAGIGVGVSTTVRFMGGGGETAGVFDDPVLPIAPAKPANAKIPIII